MTGRKEQGFVAHTANPVRKDGENEAERLRSDLQDAHLKVSRYAWEAGFYKGVLEGSLLMLESRLRPLDETITHIRSKLAEFEAKNGKAR